MSQENHSLGESQKAYLLQSLSIVRRIVLSKLGLVHRDSVEDLKQQVFLKLWRWKIHQKGRDLSEEEWQKLASVTAHHEIVEYFSSKHRRTVLFSQIDNFDEELSGFNQASGSNQSPPPSNSAIETRSLLLLVWKASKDLTLRQKYAFMLHNPDFIVDFISAGCCSMKELTEYFEASEAELLVLAEADSLPDKEIAEILEKKLGTKVSPKAVWEARGKAKAKIAKKLAELMTNDGTSERRNT